MLPADTEHSEAEHHHNPTAGLYVVVWIALVVLATATFFLSHAVAGGWGMVIALTIATVKAGLVMAFFMHLAHGRSLYRIVIVACVGFVVLLILGIVADVGTRSVAGPYFGDPVRTPAD